MNNNTHYVAKLSNGKYYYGFGDVTDELTFAKKYVYDWSLTKDNYLNDYCNWKGLTYKCIKVKVVHEIIK